MSDIPWFIDIPPVYNCPVCHKDSIELFTEADRPCGYKTLIKAYKDREVMITQRFDTVTLSHFKCVNCGQEYMISWIYGYPVPYTGGDPLCCWQG